MRSIGISIACAAPIVLAGCGGGGDDQPKVKLAGVTYEVKSASVRNPDFAAFVPGNFIGVRLQVTVGGEGPRRLSPDQFRLTAPGVPGVSASATGAPPGEDPRGRLQPNTDGRIGLVFISKEARPGKGRLRIQAPDGSASTATLSLDVQAPPKGKRTPIRGSVTAAPGNTGLSGP
jgi:hypothetical protein